MHLSWLQLGGGWQWMWSCAKALARVKPHFHPALPVGSLLCTTWFCAANLAESCTAPSEVLQSCHKPTLVGRRMRRPSCRASWGTRPRFSWRRRRPPARWPWRSRPARRLSRRASAPASWSAPWPSCAAAAAAAGPAWRRPVGAVCVEMMDGDTCCLRRSRWPVEASWLCKSL